MNSEQKKIGKHTSKPWFQKIRSKSGKSTTLVWHGGPLCEFGERVLQWCADNQKLGDKLRELFYLDPTRMKGASLSVSGDGASGSWSRCPNDMADKAEQMILEVHRIALAVIQDATWEQRRLFLEGELVLAAPSPWKGEPPPWMVGVEQDMTRMMLVPPWIAKEFVPPPPPWMVPTHQT
ncbi:MAG: hypothetical protein ABL877_10030 [Thiobacillus sp.]